MGEFMNDCEHELKFLANMLLNICKKNPMILTLCAHATKYAAHTLTAIPRMQQYMYLVIHAHMHTSACMAEWKEMYVVLNISIY